jgi:hypothetical protein
VVYTYKFDGRQVGDLRLARQKYVALQEAFRLLRDTLEGWNEQALAHGAASRPYEREVTDLGQMIEWGDRRLGHKDATEVVVDGISIGSLRYAKAALLLMAYRRQEDRTKKAALGWPSAAMRSLDEAIENINQIAAMIEQEPCEVLWEVIPNTSASSVEMVTPDGSSWDVFISHASEDKEGFVRPLAEKLRTRGLSVWFDEVTLKIGDSLRRAIDGGLARSRFGVVVISPSFLQKEWPQKELDGLVAREVSGVKVVLPVWHNITSNAIRKYSPLLADRYAASSDRGLDDVVEKILDAVGKGERVSMPPQLMRSQAQSDVRVTLRGTARDARIVVENLGPNLVRNVRLTIDGLQGKESPLVRGDYDEKIPIEVLRPRSHVELLAALTFGTGVIFQATWQWEEADGRIEKRSEKVSLQRF